CARCPRGRPDAAVEAAGPCDSTPCAPGDRRPPSAWPSRRAPAARGGLAVRAPRRQRRPPRCGHPARRAWPSRRSGGPAAGSAPLEEAPRGTAGSATRSRRRRLRLATDLPGHLTRREDALDLEVEVIGVGRGVARRLVGDQLFAVEAEQRL